MPGGDLRRPTGALALGDSVRVGQTLRFFVRGLVIDVGEEPTRRAPAPRGRGRRSRCADARAPASRQPVIDSVFPLAEARAAHERLEAGEQFGKVMREDANTNADTLERAIAFFAELGLDPPEAVMTDG